VYKNHSKKNKEAIVLEITTVEIISSFLCGIYIYSYFLDYYIWRIFSRVLEDQSYILRKTLALPLPLVLFTPCESHASTIPSSTTHSCPVNLSQDQAYPIFVFISIPMIFFDFFPQRIYFTKNHGVYKKI
jgi:hypothetical protein